MTASSADLIFVGILFLLIIPLEAVESVASIRAGIGKGFWEQSLDDKLDHVVNFRREWWLIGAVWIGFLAVLMAGTGGLTFLVADGGEGTLAWASFGAFALAAVAWLGGVTGQTAGVVVAAQQRVESGVTPRWIHPLWQSAYMTEGTWIILANLSYVGFGIAILWTDLVAAWAGWVAISLGALIPVAVVVTRGGFPQLPLLVPLVLGVALLIEGL